MPVNIDIADARTILYRDLDRNISIINFIDEQEPESICQYGESLVVRLNGDVYISCQSEQELQQIAADLTDQDSFFASIEPWMIPHLKKGRTPVMEMTLQRFLLDTDIPLPPVIHEVRPLTPDHAELVSRHWKTGGDADGNATDYISSRLRIGISAAVYVDGEPVAWCATHGDGSLGFMYIMEPYRRRGYARDITVTLVNQQRQSGKPSLITIAENNANSLGLARRLGFKPAGLCSWLEFAETC